MGTLTEVIALGLDDGLLNDLQNGQVVQEAVVGTLQVDGDFPIAGLLNAFDGADVVLHVGHVLVAVQGEHNVIGGHGVAAVELNALTDLKDIVLAVILDFPGLSQTGMDNGLVIGEHQSLEDPLKVLHGDGLGVGHGVGGQNGLANSDVQSVLDLLGGIGGAGGSRCSASGIGSCAGGGTATTTGNQTQNHDQGQCERQELLHLGILLLFLTFLPADGANCSAPTHLTWARIAAFGGGECILLSRSVLTF